MTRDNEQASPDGAEMLIVRPETWIGVDKSSVSAGGNPVDDGFSGASRFAV